MSISTKSGTESADARSLKEQHLNDSYQKEGEYTVEHVHYEQV
jgi:hypothetical protein